MSYVTLTLLRFDTFAARAWAFAQMGFARFAVSRLSGLEFYKMMGTGAGAGFSTKPDFGRYTLLCVWDCEAAAIAALRDACVFKNYSSHANQCATLHLEATQSRGLWNGSEPFGDTFTEQGNPVVALTRATLAAKHVWKFWADVPSISDAIQKEPSMRFMMGMGEVPWLHQVTFSIWDDREAMVNFSRKSASHGEAVKKAYSNGWFKENLFARFNLTKIDGAWDGLEIIASRLALNDNFSDAA